MFSPLRSLDAWIEKDHNAHRSFATRRAAELVVRESMKLDPEAFGPRCSLVIFPRSDGRHVPVIINPAWASMVVHQFMLPVWA